MSGKPNAGNEIVVFQAQPTTNADQEGFTLVRGKGRRRRGRGGDRGEARTAVPAPGGANIRNLFSRYTKDVQHMTPPSLPSQETGSMIL